MDVDNNALAIFLKGIHFTALCPIILTNKVNAFCNAQVIHTLLLSEILNEKKKKATKNQLTWFFGWRGEGEAEVGAVFGIQPPLVLLTPPSHSIQTHTCKEKELKISRMHKINQSHSDESTKRNDYVAK